MSSEYLQSDILVFIFNRTIMNILQMKEFIDKNLNIES